MPAGMIPKGRAWAELAARLPAAFIGTPMAVAYEERAHVHLWRLRDEVGQEWSARVERPRGSDAVYVYVRLVAPRRNPPPAIGLPPRDDLSRGDYASLFGDADRDGIPDADDAEPFRPSSVQVEETRLADTMGDVLERRQDYVVARARIEPLLRGMAPHGAYVYGRVKSPYSIVGKLVKTHLEDLWDLAGLTIKVRTADEAREVAQNIRAGALGPIMEDSDFYAAPKAGYRAFHFIVQAGQWTDSKGAVHPVPVEVQVKTYRQGVINELSHSAYKRGTLDGDYMASLTSLAALADEGDASATRKIDAILADPVTVQHRMTKA